MNRRRRRSKRKPSLRRWKGKYVKRWSSISD
jgi:hypothetical protein